MGGRCAGDIWYSESRASLSDPGSLWVDGGRVYSVREQRSGNETARENQPTDSVTAERDQISLVYTESLF